MGNMNASRILIGGIVAGVVINIGTYILNAYLLGTDMTAAITRMNLGPIGYEAMACFIVLGVVVGIATIWLYAAIRPRYGAGPKTAVWSGAAVWFFAYLYPGIGMIAMGMFPTSLMAVSLAWGLIEMLLAAQAGAFLYKE